MAPRARWHRVVVIALDGVIAADLGLPQEVLGRTQLQDGRHPYEVCVASERASVDAGLFKIRPPHRLDQLRRADTIVVPGRIDPFAPTPPAVLTELQRAGHRGARLVSICVGAFILAEAGLLDGQRATTHWAAAGELASRFPDIDVDANVLFVDNGQVLTSAGAASGFDVLLHIIELDHGSAVAAETARSVVMPLSRRGGQAQFISSRPPRAEGPRLAPTLEWIEANLDQPLTLAAISEHAAMSPRSLNRRFLEQTGTTPNRWLNQARLQRAREMLEATDDPIETIAYAAGFGSPITFRERFTRDVGISPRDYRSAFRATRARIA